MNSETINALGLFMIPNHEDSQLYMVFETILLLNDNIKQTTF